MKNAIFFAAVLLLTLGGADAPVRPRGEAAVIPEESGRGSTPQPGGRGRPPLQTAAEADAKSTGCLTCHKNIEPMHQSAAVRLGCTDCHGGNATATKKEEAHVHPRHPELWKTSANPPRTYTRWLDESPEFVKFVNPGDLRVAQETCGGCHQKEVNAVPRSTMTTNSVFWTAAGYANGVISRKPAILGESYSREGNAQSLKPVTPPTPDQIAHGALPQLVPLPKWEITQPGEYFRAFERGGVAQGSQPPEIGNPNSNEEAGRPDIHLGNRGRGTGLRISPALINLHKTRLNDPHLSMLGTNDHPGDYRSSGCSACHVVYANDRDPLHSASYAFFGNTGLSQTADTTIPKNEKGHPIRHRFTRAVPTSQCMSCHMHQPNSFVNTYLGYTMWDYETDARLLWPKKQKYPTEAEKRASLDHNPEGAAPRGLWTDIDFLENVTSLNKDAKNTQFADYHGHGWNFMAVYKRDRKGNLLDANGDRVRFDDPDKFKKAVHLRDIHLEKGMHCVDCHFAQDEHGNGQLYGEYGNNIEIECQDCHGTIDHYTNLKTSGPAAPQGGTDLRMGTTPFGRRRFAWINNRLVQRSMLNPEVEWEVIQTKDTITPGNPHYNERSAYAKTIKNSGGAIAHSDDKMTCYACHTSWMTSCSGCHLPQESNSKSETHHYETLETRNFASYNPQVIRTDAFMLGVNGTTKGHRLAPVRSSSALVISSTNAARDHIYIQQPPISAPGYSSQAFNPHVPHTVRSRETQGCNSCHVTKANDNNAWMAQLLLQGTNMVNFVGRYAYVAEGDKGFEAIGVTEWDEPQAVIGSSLHEIVYPDYYAAHEKRGMELEVAHHHHGDARSVQMRGEYLFAANGEEGFEVYDIANVDNKDTSERISSAPVSPIGQRTFVKTKFASAVALPTTMPMQPNRQTQFIPENQEQPIHPLYKYAYIADREEGLILVDVTTLTDGDPSNNYLSRALTWNPSPPTPLPANAGRGESLASDQSPLPAARGEGGRRPGEGQLDYAYIADREEGLILVDVTTLTDGDPSNNYLTRALTWNASPPTPLPANAGRGESLASDQPPLPAARGEGGRRPGEGQLDGASSIAIAGRWLYIGCDEGVAIIDIDKPLAPKIVATIKEAEKPTSIAIQFRYAFITDAKGLRVVDVTDPANPRLAATLPIADARNVYVARTYAYVAAGAQGMVIVDVEKPEAPFVDQVFNANGQLKDTTDIKVASTNASVFAYVADGKYGFKVVQLTSPEWLPTYAGFSPRPAPRLIATRRTEGPAIAVSKGLDRDRAVDESGNQVSIFNRIGARPMTLPEMQRLYLRDGKLYTVEEK
jgi:hypothetical protein